MYNLFSDSFEKIAYQQVTILPEKKTKFYKHSSHKNPQPDLTPSLEDAAVDPAEVTIGEIFFLETRFAQFFKANSGGNANQRLDKGDPVVDRVTTLGNSLPGPFAGQSINCRSCHFKEKVLLQNWQYQGLKSEMPILIYSYLPLATIPMLKEYF